MAARGCLPGKDRSKETLFEKMSSSLEEIAISYISEDLSESFNRCVGSVSLERKYLATTVPYPLSSTIEYVRSMIKNGYPLYVALDSQRQVVGWCDVVPKRHEGMNHVGVLALGVKKEYRGRGLGTRLLKHAIAHAARMGLEKIELEVFESNRLALRLYQEFGFVLEGRKVRSRKLNGVYDHILLMGKFL